MPTGAGCPTGPGKPGLRNSEFSTPNTDMYEKCFEYFVYGLQFTV